MVSVRDYLDQIADHAHPRIVECGMSCRVDAPSNLHARLDPERMRQVVDNLIDNSFRYCPRGSAIALRAGRVDQDLWLEVADDGPGFDPAFLPHAFERFRRSDTSRSRDHGGSGLGLAIVQSIVSADDGTVIAENQLSGGACVRVTLRDAHRARPDARRDGVTPRCPDVYGAGAVSDGVGTASRIRQRHEVDLQQIEREVQN